MYSNLIIHSNIYRIIRNNLEQKLLIGKNIFTKKNKKI